MDEEKELSIKIPQGSPEFEFEKYKTLEANRTSHFQAHLASMTVYANTVFRGLFLLNGAVGLTAFVNSSPQNQSIKYCVLGAIAAVCASILAYLSQRFYMAADLRTCSQDMERLFGLEISKRGRCEQYEVGVVFLGATCVAVVVSLVFFCIALP